MQDLFTHYAFRIDPVYGYKSYPCFCSASGTHRVGQEEI